MKLLLFDIDGTLVSLKRGISRGIFIDSFQEILGEKIEQAHLPHMSGMTDLSILEICAQNANIPKEIIFSNIDKFWEYFETRFEELVNRETMILHDGVGELLNKLASESDFRLALLTGNYRKNAYRKIRLFDLDKYFSVGAFGDDHIDRSKLPQIAYSRVKSHFGEDFDRTSSIIIGDSPNDVICAQKNNMPILAVASGGHPKAELAAMNPNILADDLSDIDYIIEALRAL